MRASGTWSGGFATRLDDGRGHEVVVDLPEDEGGSDVGTSALELSVLALTGCIATIFRLVAAKRRLQYQRLTIELSASRPPGFLTIEAVDGVFEIGTDAPMEDV